MISLICQKSPGGTINLKDKEAQTLIDSDAKSIHTTTESFISKKLKSTDYRVKPRPQSYHVSRNTLQAQTNKQAPTQMTLLIERPASSYVSTSDYNAQLPVSRISAKKLQKVQNWIDEQIVKKNHYLNNINKSKKRISLHEYYQLKVKEEAKLHADLNQTLAENELKTQQKKEIIYRDWLFRVYEPLKREISKIQHQNYVEEAQKRDECYVEYLKQVNTHGAVYQDDYDPNEYNPMRRFNVKKSFSNNINRTSHANIHERKLTREKTIISICDNKENEKQRLLSLRCRNTRSDINWDQWLKEKYNDIESTERIRSGLKCKPSRNNSKVEISWTNDVISSNIIKQQQNSMISIMNKSDIEVK